VLLVASFFTDRALSALPLDNAVHIDLVAHRFWWDARYESHDPALAFWTANELHVPVGRTVLVRLRAFDVIHSFWVPSLTGKKDLIPGRESTIAFRVDKPGVYRGQCAEFCGYQHAHMALIVVAESASDYDRWSALQRQPAPAPATAQQQRGLQLVEQTTCAMCHAISGTSAGGRRAPDLTHFASRSSIGAGTLENTPSARTEWIANAQEYKPGADMPPLAMSADDLVAISSYLGTLR
jgi:cytochrome c oxidase subunit 2